MAAANAILRHRRMQQIRKKVEEEVDNDNRPDDADYSDSSSSPTRSLVIFELALNVTLSLLPYIMKILTYCHLAAGR